MFFFFFSFFRLLKLFNVSALLGAVLHQLGADTSWETKLLKKDVIYDVCFLILSAHSSVDKTME